MMAGQVGLGEDPRQHHEMRQLEPDTVAQSKLLQCVRRGRVERTNA
jgi:hypothetical protein